MAVYVTADHHFGHEKIITHCGRPFANVTEMDLALVREWNRTVRPTDTVYYLGDFAFRSDPLVYLRQLHGTIRLVPGSHDKQTVFQRSGIEILNALTECKIDGRRIVLCHYPLMTWHGKERGAVHLHAHSHGRIPDRPGFYDVGIDAAGYTPILMQGWLDRAAAEVRDEEARTQIGVVRTQLGTVQ